MATAVSGSAGEFRAGTPQVLFNALRALGVLNFDVSPDGRRFLVITERIETRSAPVVVTLNWMSGITR